MVLGVLAHVDAGKTTLIEAMLYHAGATRRAGRVDHGDAFLDTDRMERARGITIFSKQARLRLGETSVVLLDTPGHVDFSSEMERTLSVLDAAVLVVSATDGLQSHTKTLWRLLSRHSIPTIIFVNKTDLEGYDRAALMAQLGSLAEGMVDFLPGKNATYADAEARDEQIAVLDAALMEKYFEGEMPTAADVARLVRQRLLFPCFFGAALRLRGVEQMLDALQLWAPHLCRTDRDAAFGARVYKISRDADGARLSWLRVTSGTLRVRDIVQYHPRSGQDTLTEKISRIRLYSGNSFTQVDAVSAGEICAVVGLSMTYAGQALGDATPAAGAMLEGVLTYGLQLPPHADPMTVLPKLRQLEEEDPLLRILWQPRLQQIQLQVMGEVQLEVLQQIIRDRFDLEVTFDEGSILYRETLSAPVEGVGHYEPLRHYAEVHLYMEPLPPGSGVVITSACDSAMLDYSWQHQVLTALEEKVHVGVLGGFPITDIKITLVSGRAHLKHTEGGDFRQAAWRALRQGWMRAAERGACLLLEPMERIELSLPRACVGRAMTDLQSMGATFELQAGEDDADSALLVGRASAAALRGYAREVAAYSRGEGKLSCAYDGYASCHNTQEVLRSLRYEPTHDLENPCDSVFCAHGAGFSVPWNEVEAHMHLPPYVTRRPDDHLSTASDAERQPRRAAFIEDKELEAIMEREFGPIRRRSYGEKRVVAQVSHKTASTAPKLRRLVLDGYNVIFGWEVLSEIAADAIETARELLIDAMCNYAGYVDVPVDIVFDAYRVKGGVGEEYQKGNVHIVYTKENETADAYIERLLTRESRDYTIRVVTSDRLVQVTAVSTGVLRMSVPEFVRELESVREEILRVAKENGK